MKMSMLIGALTGSVVLAACAPTMQNTSPSNSVWVCHGDQNRQWQRVPANEGSSHRDHGDRVTDNRQREGQSCDNASDSRDSRDRRDH